MYVWKKKYFCAIKNANCISHCRKIFNRKNLFVVLKIQELNLKKQSINKTKSFLCKEEAKININKLEKKRC